MNLIENIAMLEKELEARKKAKTELEVERKKLIDRLDIINTTLGLLKVSAPVVPSKPVTKTKQAVPAPVMLRTRALRKLPENATAQHDFVSALADIGVAASITELAAKMQRTYNATYNIATELLIKSIIVRTADNKFWLKP